MAYIEATIEDPEDQYIFIAQTSRFPQAEAYKKMTRCTFDADVAYGSLIGFIRECKEKIGAVTVSIVGGYQSPEDEERCRQIAEALGVRFRVR